MGIETDIEAALHARLVALVLNPVLKIAFPSQTFTPTTLPYLRPTNLPARTEPMSLSPLGPNDHVGIYQISVFWPAGRVAASAQDGVNPILDVVSAITTHFRRGTKMTRGSVSVWVDGAPWPSAAIQEPSWYQVPVSVPYRAFVDGL